MLNNRIKGLLFHYKKKCYFAVGLYFSVRVFTENPDSVCDNNVNNEQNVRVYYMPDLSMRDQLFYCKRKMLFRLLFSSKRYPKYPDSVDQP